jgi:hypothetical protein
MNGVELSDDLPKSFLEKAARMGVHEKELRGAPRFSSGTQSQECRTEAERVVNYLKKTVFPKVGA